MSDLIVSHPGGNGIFSCCTVWITYVINYLNEHKKLPANIIYRDIFQMYQKNFHSKEENIRSLLFEEERTDIEAPYTTPIDYHFDTQFTPYKNLDFVNVNLLTQRYFTPSQEVKTLITKFEEHYKINYDNTVSVFYRGNDKVKETPIGTYESFFGKCREILNNNPNINFLVQTDEREFREEFIKNFNNSFYLNELPTMSKNPFISMQHNVIPEHRPKFAQSMLAATVIVSKCKHLVTHSGNCGIWAVQYRGNIDNVHQILKDEWI